jgi:predicted nucleic acid-binding protein
MSGILIDTNILVYAHDADEAQKRQRAINALEYLGVSHVGRLSVQCLSEFVSIVTRSKKPLLTISQATQQVEWLISTYPVLDINVEVVIEALLGVRHYQLAFWDAQLWATARLNQIPVIFSEDFNTGSSLGGVRFVNPLADDFVIEKWV